jgi:hypothetical protein
MAATERRGFHVKVFSRWAIVLVLTPGGASPAPTILTYGERA